MTEATEVKKNILSLLTSTPTVLTVGKLCKDYKDMIGEHLPFPRTQFNSVEQFLKSMPETCHVNGSGPFAIVTPVINDRIAHINDMVMRQKKPQGRNIVGFRRKTFPKAQSRFPVPPSPSTSFTPQKGNVNARTYFNSGQTQKVETEKRVLEIDKKPMPVDKEPMPVDQKPMYVNTKPMPIDTKPMPFAKTAVLNNSSDNVITSRKKHLESLIETQISLGNVCKPPENTPPKEVKSVPDNAPVLDKEDEFFFTSKNLETFKQPFKSSQIEMKLPNENECDNIPKKVQSNLQKLISQFPEGIWCAQLPAQYRKSFRRELTYKDFGFSTLIEMCIALKDVFHYVRPGKDDFKLYDRTKPLPESVEKTFTVASFAPPQQLGTMNPNDPWPDLVWTDFTGHIPPNVFSLGREIPKQFLPEGSKTDDVFDVVVVEIYDPSKFWFYLGESNKKSQLDDLMDELNAFYQSEEVKKEYAVPPALIQEGLYCVQVIYGEYHRAKIIRVFPDPEYVKVFYIDYGTACKAPVEGMCFLHARFADLPAQAIRCRLANVVPTTRGHPWPREASDYFRNAVSRSDTKIRLSYVNWDEEYACAFLADVTNPDDVSYVNEVLVRAGHAVWDGEVISGATYSVERAKHRLGLWKLAMRRRRALERGRRQS